MKKAVRSLILLLAACAAAFLLSHRMSGGLTEGLSNGTMSPGGAPAPMLKGSLEASGEAEGVTGSDDSIDSSRAAATGASAAVRALRRAAPSTAPSKVDVKFVEDIPAFEADAGHAPVREKTTAEMPTAGKNSESATEAMDMAGEKRPVTGWFETTVEAKPANGSIAIEFSLRNVSGREVRIRHGSGQQYDIAVINERGEEVFRWSEGKAFTQALVERVLKADERLDFREEWNLKDNDGRPVPPGTYRIVVEVLIGVDSVRLDRAQLRATAVVDVQAG